MSLCLSNECMRWSMKQHFKHRKLFAFVERVIPTRTLLLIFHEVEHFQLEHQDCNKTKSAIWWILDFLLHLFCFFSFFLLLFNPIKFNSPKHFYFTQLSMQKSLKSSKVSHEYDLLSVIFQALIAMAFAQIGWPHNEFQSLLLKFTIADACHFVDNTMQMEKE